MSVLEGGRIVIKGVEAPKECCIAVVSTWETNCEGMVHECGICGNVLKSSRLDSIPAGTEFTGNLFMDELRRATAPGEAYEIQQVFLSEKVNTDSNQRDHVAQKYGINPDRTRAGMTGTFMAKGPEAFFKADPVLMMNLGYGVAAVCASRKAGLEGPLPFEFEFNPIWW